MNDALQRHTFAAQLLRMLGLVPDLGFGEFALDLYQAFGLFSVVKDTPVTLRCGTACL